MEAKRFSTRQDADGIFFLTGELTIHDLEYLKEFFDTLIARKGKLILNLAGVSFADTAFLQLFIAFRKRVQSVNECLIDGMSPELERIFTVSGLRFFLED
jgi:anti-anti-sigma factor